MTRPPSKVFQMSASLAGLPAPPVPPDADLTDFKFMPLEVARLRRSKAWLICKRRPDLAFFMLNLWTASWHERPAGSLEDDDDVLADAAMCSPERWAKVRAEVMRGWFKASDGRLYHPVVAEKVMDSWYGKMVARWRKECERIRKENSRREKKGLPLLDLPAEPDRPSVSDPEDEGGTAAGNPEEKPKASKDVRGPSMDKTRTVHGNPPENALKGEGRDRDREKEEAYASSARAMSADVPADKPPDDAAGKLPETPDGAPEAVDGEQAESIPRTEKPPDHLNIPPFLRRQPDRLAANIPPDFQPQPSTRDAVLDARPDLSEADLHRRHNEFRIWCAAKAVTSHNFDATWYSFMVKTHVQRSSDNEERGLTAAIAGALAAGSG